MAFEAVSWILLILVAIEFLLRLFICVKKSIDNFLQVRLSKFISAIESGIRAIKSGIRVIKSGIRVIKPGIKLKVPHRLTKRFPRIPTTTSSSLFTNLLGLSVWEERFV